MRIDQQSTSQEYKIHNIIILDASGSMSGPKYTIAKEGVLQELQLSIDRNYTFSFTEFVQSGKIIHHYKRAEPHNVTLNFYGAVGGDTPLYKTVYDVITNLRENRSSTDKFLVKIFTDGQNNTEHEMEEPCRKLIKQVEKEGFTITFSAYERDANTIMRALEIDSSNVQTHKNTVESIKTSFTTQQEATLLYEKKVAKGEDVTRGFYSKTLTND